MVFLLAGMIVFAQEGMNEILSGNLVSPQTGTWTGYIVKNEQGMDISRLRMAIVGMEKMGGDHGYWLEVEEEDVSIPGGFIQVLPMGKGGTETQSVIDDAALSAKQMDPNAKIAKNANKTVARQIIPMEKFKSKGE